MSQHAQRPPTVSEDVEIDYSFLWRRIKGSVPQTLGLACLAAVVGLAVAFWRGTAAAPATTIMVRFNFSGIEKGQNPDGTAFVVEELRAPENVSAAVRAAQLDLKPEQQARLRSSLTIVGQYPEEAGPAKAPFFPDVYTLSLDPRRSGVESAATREAFLAALVESYRDRFQRTYGALPLQLGTVFTTLENIDYAEYEIVLNEEVLALQRFLEKRSALAPDFRSLRTGLTFPELEGRLRQYVAIKQAGVLGLVAAAGPSGERAGATARMDYRLRLLTEEEKLARDREKVVLDLLDRLDRRETSYVLARKAPGAGAADGTPTIDHGLIETMIKNDAYGYLVREALQAGQKAREVASQRAAIEDWRQRLEALPEEKEAQRQRLAAGAGAAMAQLKGDYLALIAVIRQTDEDFLARYLADAVRVAHGPVTPPPAPVNLRVVAGWTLAGLLLGLGLGLVGLNGRRSV
jgi:hypothetical protein